MKPKPHTNLVTNVLHLRLPSFLSDLLFSAGVISPNNSFFLLSVRYSLLQMKSVRTFRSDVFVSKASCDRIYQLLAIVAMSNESGQRLNRKMDCTLNANVKPAGEGRGEVDQWMEGCIIEIRKLDGIR
jgi:hypothetical protein